MGEGDKELKDVVEDLYVCDPLPDSSEMQFHLLTGSNFKDDGPVSFNVVDSPADLGRAYVLAIDFRPKVGEQNWFFKSNVRARSGSDKGPTVNSAIGEKIGLHLYCRVSETIVVSFDSDGGDWDLFLIKKK